MRLAALLLFSGCASLRTGWARVTWATGRVATEVACSTRINAEGDIDMVCVPMNAVQRDLLFKSEKRRATGGDT